jgi:hypothetical protein
MAHFAQVSAGLDGAVPPLSPSGHRTTYILFECGITTVMAEFRKAHWDRLMRCRDFLRKLSDMNLATGRGGEQMGAKRDRPNLDDPRAVEAETKLVMQERGLFWAFGPGPVERPSSGSPTGKVMLFDGSIKCAVTGKSIAIEPQIDALGFWTAAYYTALDENWEV